MALVPWPAEEQRRRHLSDFKQPRLLLVAPDAPPPAIDDLLEDWIRVPAHDADVQARIAVLSTRAASSRTPVRHDGPPELDEDGVLRFGGSWVSLPPVEARITVALLSKFGAVVSRETLASSAWPDGAPGRNALDVHVVRLRRRLAVVGLAIRTVRSRGYLLEAAEASSVRARYA